MVENPEDKFSRDEAHVEFPFSHTINTQVTSSRCQTLSESAHSLNISLRPLAVIWSPWQWIRARLTGWRLEISSKQESSRSDFFLIVMYFPEIYGPGHAKTCLMPYANNKGADQPAHPRSLISTFVVRCLDSMICILAISKVSGF